jgi:hypothetical protein
MNELFQDAITGLISGATAAAFTALLFRSRIRQELLVEYDKELRSSRLEAYKRLFPMFVPIARYSREKDPTYAELKDLATKMRGWYFADGGIYLSAKSRQPYFDLKKLLDTLVSTRGAESLGDTVDPDTLNSVVESGSELRRVLADDVGARREPLLADN